MKEKIEFRSRFAALRDEDARRAPSFDQVLRRRPTRKGIGLPGFAATACLVLASVSAIVVQIVPHRTPPLQVAVSLAKWRAPTDFLLYTQGRELLQSVPVFGDSTHNLLISFPSLDLADPHPKGQEPLT